MAKELPYFKFEPNQWDNGKIQMLPREDKGLFIDLCSMYWSRLGNVPLKLAIQKLCGGNATALNSLCDDKIIDISDGYIFIKFLSEQLDEFKDISKQNSKNAKEGWEKRRKQKELSERNATVLNSQSESDAIREEKKREDKKRRENKIKNILLSEIDISDVDIKFLEYYKIAFKFYELFKKNLIEKNTSTARIEKSKYFDFVNPIRLMFEQDKITKEQLVIVYNFLSSPSSDFWKKNILSTKKLREKFESISIEANSKKEVKLFNQLPTVKFHTNR